MSRTNPAYFQMLESGITLSLVKILKATFENEVHSDYGKVEFEPRKEINLKEDLLVTCRFSHIKNDS